MASKHRQSANANSTRRTGSPVPEYFVDLTVDSPVQRRSQPNRRPTVLRISQNAESSQAATADVLNVDAADCLNRLLPPKKRARKEKTAKEDTTINQNKVSRVNDSMTGESTVLSCPICLDVLTSKRKPTSTRCGHIYCAECIEQIATTSKKCPTCQSSITHKSCIRLYF